MSTFVITKSLIKGFCDRGLTMSRMAEEVTKMSNEKCTEAVIKKAAKHYGIDMRKKPQTSAFEFENSENTATDIEGIKVTTEEVPEGQLEEVGA